VREDGGAGPAAPRGWGARAWLPSCCRTKADSARAGPVRRESPRASPERRSRAFSFACGRLGG
jgi:hypothetical protein